MKKINRILTAAVLGTALAFAAAAQTPGSGGGFGARGFGRPTGGQITEIAADHITIKTESGDSLKVVYNTNTRVMQRTAPPAGEASPGEGRPRGGGEPIQISDLKVGDIVAVMGQQDASTKSIGAMAIIRLDANAAKRAKEMEANYGKTWLGGKVTAIQETTITVTGQVDQKTHSFVVDENTSFSKRRESITLSDIKVGDMVMAQGALKGDVFTATKVNDMGDRAPGGPHPDGGQRPNGPPPTDAPNQ